MLTNINVEEFMSKQIDLQKKVATYLLTAKALVFFAANSDNFSDKPKSIKQRYFMALFDLIEEISKLKAANAQYLDDFRKSTFKL